MAKVNEGCRSAGIGFIECKGWAADALVKILNPMQERRKKYEDNPRLAWDFLRRVRPLARGCGRHDGRSTRFDGHVAQLRGVTERRKVTDLSRLPRTGGGSSLRTRDRHDFFRRHASRRK